MGDIETERVSGYATKLERRKVVAIIPARGGSKGVPRKNLRELAGKPLIVHTIEAALQCSLVDKCIVSTEDEEIKTISLRAGAEVVDRPAKFATDKSRSEDVVRHVLEQLNNEHLPEFFVLLQPTSPLRSAEHLTECINNSIEMNSNCTISVTEVEHHPYKAFYYENSELVPLKDRTSLSKPRQELPSVFRQNGAIYFMNCTDFLREDSFFLDGALPYIMDSDVSIDIDTALDFHICESLMLECKLLKA